MKDNCNYSTIQDYLDGELSKTQTEYIKQHIECCPNCHAEYLKLSRIKSILQNKYTLPEAPKRLTHNIQRQSRQLSQKRTWSTPLLIITATLLIASVVLWLRPKSEPFPLAQKIVDDYQQRTNALQPWQISTSNSQKMESWFAQQWNLPVAIPKVLSSQLFLEGGRLCKVSTIPVCIAFYRFEQHRLSLYVMQTQDLPDSFSKVCHQEPHEECSIVWWQNQNLVYAMVMSKPSNYLQKIVNQHLEVN